MQTVKVATVHGKMEALYSFYNSFQDWLLSNVQLLVDGTFPSAFSKTSGIDKSPIFFDATHVDGWMNMKTMSEQVKF